MVFVYMEAMHFCDEADKRKARKELIKSIKKETKDCKMKSDKLAGF